MLCDVGHQKMQGAQYRKCGGSNHVSSRYSHLSLDGYELKMMHEQTGVLTDQQDRSEE